MSVANFEVRRATIEDLPDLRQIWEKTHLPVAQLEKRVTEFQIAQSANGLILGCLGLQLQRHNGLIHSEAYQKSDLASDLRRPLWDRIQAVARNHGLAKLWTLDSEPFWQVQGFRAATETELSNLPAEWGLPGQEWKVLPLKDETVTALSIEQEFELFKQSQKELSARTLRHAKVLRLFASLIAISGLVAIVWMIVVLLKRLPGKL